MAAPVVNDYVQYRHGTKAPVFPPNGNADDLDTHIRQYELIMPQMEPATDAAKISHFKATVGVEGIDKYLTGIRTAAEGALAAPTFNQYLTAVRERLAGSVGPDVLLANFESMRQGETETLDEFIRRFNRCCAGLDQLGQPVTEAQKARRFRVALRSDLALAVLDRPEGETYAQLTDFLKRRAANVKQYALLHHREVLAPDSYLNALVSNSQPSKQIEALRAMRQLEEWHDAPRAQRPANLDHEIGQLRASVLAGVGGEVSHLPTLNVADLRASLIHSRMRGDRDGMLPAAIVDHRIRQLVDALNKEMTSRTKQGRHHRQLIHECEGMVDSVEEQLESNNVYIDAIRRKLGLKRPGQKRAGKHARSQFIDDEAKVAGDSEDEESEAPSRHAPLDYPQTSPSPEPLIFKPITKKYAALYEREKKERSKKKHRGSSKSKPQRSESEKEDGDEGEEEYSASPPPPPRRSKSPVQPSRSKSPAPPRRLQPSPSPSVHSMRHDPLAEAEERGRVNAEAKYQLETLKRELKAAAEEKEAARQARMQAEKLTAQLHQQRTQEQVNRSSGGSGGGRGSNRNGDNNNNGNSNNNRNRGDSGSGNGGNRNSDNNISNRGSGRGRGSQRHDLHCDNCGRDTHVEADCYSSRTAGSTKGPRWFGWDRIDDHENPWLNGTREKEGHPGTKLAAHPTTLVGVKPSTLSFISNFESFMEHNTRSSIAPARKGDD